MYLPPPNVASPRPSNKPRPPSYLNRSLDREKMTTELVTFPTLRDAPKSQRPSALPDPPPVSILYDFCHGSLAGYPMNNDGSRAYGTGPCGMLPVSSSLSAWVHLGVPIPHKSSYGDHSFITMSSAADADASAVGVGSAAFPFPLPVFPESAGIATLAYVGLLYCIVFAARTEP